MLYLRERQKTSVPVFPPSSFPSHSSPLCVHHACSLSLTLLQPFFLSQLTPLDTTYLIDSTNPCFRHHSEGGTNSLRAKEAFKIRAGEAMDLLMLFDSNSHQPWPAKLVVTHDGRISSSRRMSSSQPCFYSTIKYTMEVVAGREK